MSIVVQLVCHPFIAWMIHTLLTKATNWSRHRFGTCTISAKARYGARRGAARDRHQLVSIWYSTLQYNFFATGEQLKSINKLMPSRKEDQSNSDKPAGSKITSWFRRNKSNKQQDDAKQQEDPKREVRRTLKVSPVQS